MKELVELDMPIKKRLMKTREAIELFKKHGMEDKTKLFKYRRGSYVNVYSLGTYEDYYYGYMAPSTGILKTFDLFEYDEGFVLQLPVKEKPDEVPQFNPPAKLFNVLKESTQWADMLDIHTVGALNEHITNSEMGSLMLVCEALQEQKIYDIVKMIQKRPGTKFVMIAGPSSSGKTSFSHRLSIQLRTFGITPHPISLDNYFKNREDTPIDENGNYDYESLYALDLELFNQQLQALLRGEEVELPRFNFSLGKKEYKGDKLKIEDNTILILEGIHALNPELTPHIPAERKFKIYVSALTTISLDDHNWIPTTDNRLLRRIIRDFNYRGYSARETISRWPSVRAGEDKWIFPYQENADVMFNSALLFEFAVLRLHAEPILMGVPRNCPEYCEAYRLLKFIKYFVPVQDKEIPPTSLLREFLGGSSFKY